MSPAVPTIPPPDCEICSFLPPVYADLQEEHSRIRDLLREAARILIAQRARIDTLKDENARLLSINERLLTAGPPILFSQEEGPRRAGVVGVILGTVETGGER